MHAALAAEDAGTTLLISAHAHGEVLDYLLDFAELRIDTADGIAEKLDAVGAIPDALRDRWLRDLPYGLASDALNLAVKLDENSPTVQRLLATTEVVFRDFASSYDRLSRLIVSDSSDHPLEPETRFFCVRLRSRVAFLWADRLQKDRQPIDEAMLARLKGAVKDCKWCIDTLGWHPFDVDQDVREYGAHRDKLRAMLTLARAEAELSLRDLAAKHLEASRAMFPRLRTMITVLNNGEKQRVPTAADLEARCLEVTDLLRDTSGLAGAAPGASSRGSPLRARAADCCRDRAVTRAPPRTGQVTPVWVPQRPGCAPDRAAYSVYLSD